MKLCIFMAILIISPIHLCAMSTDATNLHSTTTGAVFIQCPVIMCAPRYDPFSALLALTESKWEPAMAKSGHELIFGRRLGPFASAIVTLFNPPNTYLNHHMNPYGQIETIVSTTIVQRASFGVGITELEAVKSALEDKLDKRQVFNRHSDLNEATFTTCSSTSAGWHVELSVKKVGEYKLLFLMKLFRKRHAASPKATYNPANVDFEVTEE